MAQVIRRVSTAVAGARAEGAAAPGRGQPAPAGGFPGAGVARCGIRRCLDALARAFPFTGRGAWEAAGAGVPADKVAAGQGGPSEHPADSARRQVPPERWSARPGKGSRPMPAAAPCRPRAAQPSRPRQGRNRATLRHTTGRSGASKPTVAASPRSARPANPYDIGAIASDRVAEAEGQDQPMTTGQQVRCCGRCTTRLARGNPGVQCAACTKLARDAMLHPLSQSSAGAVAPTVVMSPRCGASAPAGNRISGAARAKVQAAGAGSFRLPRPVLCRSTHNRADSFSTVAGSAASSSAPG